MPRLPVLRFRCGCSQRSHYAKTGRGILPLDLSLDIRENFGMKCPHCQLEVSIPPALAGKDVQCPGCGKVFGAKEKGSQPEKPRGPFIKQTICQAFYLILFVVGVYFMIAAPGGSETRAESYLFKMCGIVCVAFVAFMLHLFAKSEEY